MQCDYMIDNMVITGANAGKAFFKIAELCNGVRSAAKREQIRRVVLDAYDCRLVPAGSEEVRTA